MNLKSIDIANKVNLFSYNSNKKYSSNVIVENSDANINLNNNPLSLLNKSTISFSGMKKSQFSGIDLIMINSLTKTQGFNIQSKDINSNDDFQQYCQNILDNKYLGSDNIKKLSASFDNDTQKLKEAMLTQWIDCLSNDKEKYTPSIQLLILSSITKDLDINTTNIPPVLNSKVLNLTIDEIIENSKTNKNYSPNFNKTYRSNLQKNILQSQLDENLTGWIIIPSKEHDEEHFEDNVKRLQTLSHNNWCTKGHVNKSYLANGDFHIYFEEGRPKLAIRFDKNIMQEIQGERNNSKIPVYYFELLKKYVKKNICKGNSKVLKEFEQAEQSNLIIQQMKSELGEDVFENKEYDKILPYFGIKLKKDEDGMLVLKSFKEPENYTFADIGIDENDLFKHIKEIKGDVNFETSKLTSLGSVKSIGGNADFRNSQLISLGELAAIKGDANFENSKLISLNKLKTIKGDANFENSKLISLGDLELIGKDAYFYGSKLDSLGNLKTIKGSAYFEGSKISSLGNLETIGGDITFSEAQIECIKNSLKDTLGKDNYSLDDVIKIFNAICVKFEINKDDMLNVNSYNSSTIQELGINEKELFKYIESIKGDANFESSELTSLGILESIKGCADFSNSALISLGNLKSIKGDVTFYDSCITSLGDLELIGGNVDFRNSKITSLASLKSVKGNVYMQRNNDIEIPKNIVAGRVVYF